jgi:hypothetical protein
VYLQQWAGKIEHWCPSVQIVAKGTMEPKDFKRVQFCVTGRKADEWELVYRSATLDEMYEALSQRLNLNRAEHMVHRSKGSQTWQKVARYMEASKMVYEDKDAPEDTSEETTEGANRHTQRRGSDVQIWKYGNLGTKDEDPTGT